MSYCFNPHCPQPNAPGRADQCCHCQSPLILADRYQGIQCLGKSLTAFTLEVIDIKTQQSKVCKVLLSQHPKVKALFAQEAYILRQINHPGIPKIEPNGYFVSSAHSGLDQRPCIIMEKIAGHTLSEWINVNPPIDSTQARNWLYQLIDILKQLHERDFFHRDIKPSNILLKPDGQLALIDFGATRQVTDTYLAKVGTRQDVTCIGTPGYMPPEQMEGNALPQSDFFAIGRTLVHLLTGQSPLSIPKDPSTGLLQWRSLSAAVPPSFADLLDSLMAPIPGARPANISVLQQQLDQLDHTPSFLSAIWAQVVFHRRSLVFAILLIGGVAFGWQLLGIRRPQPAGLKPIVACQNRECIGRDPVDNSCDQDMQTLTSNTGNIRKSKDYLSAYRIMLRYSKACQATWAKDEAPPGSVHYVEDREGQKYGTAVVPVDEFDEHYADMGPGDNVEIRACVEPPQDPKTCTSFVKL